MAEQAPQQTPVYQTPYGHQQPVNAPTLDPRAGRRPGETMCKVWGIILLLLGVIGVLNTLVGVAMMMGGMSGSTMVPTLSPEARAEFDRHVSEMIAASLARPTYWISTGSEVVIVLLSLVAGYFLVIRPRPRGAKLGLARAAMVLLFLPAYGYETVRVLESTTEMQVRSLEIDTRSRGRPPMDEKFTDTFGKVMAGVSYGAVFVSVALIVVINALLAFHMTRPAVREYLATVETRPPPIPGYDPSMGLLAGPGGPHPPVYSGPPPGSVPSQTHLPPPRT